VASKNGKIGQVFDSYLRTWATAQSVPVAWDGSPYTPVSGTKYVSQVLLPARPQNILVGKDSAQRYTGIYQIDVYSSTAKAKKDVDDIVTLLEAVFKVGYALTYSGTSVQVENFYADPHGFEDGWYRVSISIFYRTEL
jgi:hypothetical protein